MPDVVINVGGVTLGARFEASLAPRTCDAVRRLLPLDGQLLHVRWSGEATWIPLGDLALGVPAENATVYPRVGEVLLYPGPLSETEILIPYGRTSFASKAGALAGNHFLTIEAGIEMLPTLGHHALWRGAQSIRLTAA